MQRLLLLIALLLGAACTPTRRAESPPPPIDPTRMSHERHAHIPCGDCHRGATRPGADDHKPCDDSGCHRKEFLNPPGLFCRVCHTEVTPSPSSPLKAPLRRYPALDDAWQSLPPTFSHKTHLDAERMEGRVGFHVGCNDCHVRDNARSRPDHATCTRCHAAEAKLTGKAPRMEDCAGCHRGKPRLRARPRLIHDDLHFDHDRHRTDRKGVAIRCEECHGRSARSTKYEDHEAPRIESCVGCHDDSDRTPHDNRMRICETCHRERESTITTIAPRSHLPATERPIDHTLAFRRDHANAAERDATRCARCHTQMSGNAKQACNECHITMLPRDHRVTWRELDHGPEAVASRDRCATCHVVEFCTACHAQRPRSHGFPGSFDREHGRLARVSLRSCLTCHAESFCAKCHGATAPRKGSR